MKKSALHFSSKCNVVSSKCNVVLSKCNVVLKIFYANHTPIISPLLKMHTAVKRKGSGRKINMGEGGERHQRYRT